MAFIIYPSRNGAAAQKRRSLCSRAGRQQDACAEQRGRVRSRRSTKGERSARTIPIGDAMVSRCSRSAGRFTVDGNGAHRSRRGARSCRARRPHAVYAEEAFKMLLTVVFPCAKMTGINGETRCSARVAAGARGRRSRKTPETGRGSAARPVRAGARRGREQCCGRGGARGKNRIVPDCAAQWPLRQHGDGDMQAAWARGAGARGEGGASLRRSHCGARPARAACRPGARRGKTRCSPLQGGVRRFLRGLGAPRRFLEARRGALAAAAGINKK